jgi:hypothetical protein
MPIPNELINNTLADADEVMGNFNYLERKSNIPNGFLLNGKIDVSVASNNLTVAIKTMGGDNPSTTNPVYVRIGNNIREISSSLSVTKNAGTNWCASGSSMLATKEVDYFVYLGYNATNGVVVGFSRIPYACSYDDFSTTTTNEKYCAISTITSAVATDEYVVVGRFASTLSAGAGYTWSVPTFTAKNLIQRPIFETRSLTYVPTITAETGTITTFGTISGAYSFFGINCMVNLYVIISNKGTGAGGLNITLPFTNINTYTIFKGRETWSTGDTLSGTLGSTTIGVMDYKNATTIGNDYRIRLSGVYRIN